MIRQTVTNADPSETALRALAWTLEDADRARRLLALTGLEPGDLRERAGTRAVLSAVLGFLEAHQPDLVACAAALDVRPEELVSARAALEDRA